MDENENSWSFTSNASLPAFDWVRTETGAILGELSVYTVDNNGYKNYATVLKVEVQFKPNKPVISSLTNTTRDITLFFNSLGATSYKIHFGRWKGGPYNGHATEGDSPIKIGDKTSFTITQEFLYNYDLYFKVEAINSLGSSFSNEEKTGDAIDATWWPVSLCKGVSVEIPVKKTLGINPNTIFTAWLSDVSGSFVNKRNIGSTTPTTSSAIQILIPANVETGSGYKIQISDNSSTPIATETTIPFSISGSAPVISKQPIDITICENKIVSFVAKGKGTVSYLWEGRLKGVIKDITSAPFSGANTASLKLTRPEYSYSDYEFRCIITGNGCPTYTRWAKLTVNKTIEMGNFANNFCEDALISIPFAADCETFNVSNTFIAQMSDETGSFANPVQVGSLQGTTSGVISARIPVGKTGNGFRFRIVSTMPAYTGIDHGRSYTIFKAIHTYAPSAWQICARTNFTTAFLVGSCQSFQTGNVFTAELSDASGSFLNPLKIGTLTGTTSGTIVCNVPVDMPAGTHYRVRVISSKPYRIGGDDGLDLYIKDKYNLKISSARFGGTCTGETLTFNVSGIPTGGIISPVFSWMVNNTAVSSVYPFSSTTLKGGDVVKLRYSQVNGCSATIVETNSLTVVKDEQPARIVTPPVQNGNCGSEPVTYFVEAGGTNLKYQWMVRIGAGTWSNANDSEGYVGTKTSRLTIPANPIFIERVYRCMITGACSGYPQVVSTYTSQIYCLASNANARGIAVEETEERSSLMKGLSVYPNPTTKEVTLTKSDNLASSYVRVLSQLGKVMYEGTWNESSGKTFTIDLENYASGIYWLHIDNHVYKIIKM